MNLEVLGVGTAGAEVVGHVNLNPLSVLALLVSGIFHAVHGVVAAARDFELGYRGSKWKCPGFQFG